MPCGSVDLYLADGISMNRTERKHVLLQQHNHTVDGEARGESNLFSSEMLCLLGLKTSKCASCYSPQKTMFLLRLLFKTLEKILAKNFCLKNIQSEG